MTRLTKKTKMGPNLAFYQMNCYQFLPIRKKYGHHLRIVQEKHQTVRENLFSKPFFIFGNSFFMYWTYVYIHSFLSPIAQAREYGTLTRVSSNELIDQLFAHIMSEKKQDGYGVDDLFSTKARKASTANETHKLSVSICQ